MKKLFSKIADLVNALAIAALLISYLAPFIDPADFWPVSFFGLFDLRVRFKQGLHKVKRF